MRIQPFLTAIPDSLSRVLFSRLRISVIQRLSLRRITLLSHGPKILSCCHGGGPMPG
jgi:hypothetical protein